MSGRKDIAKAAEEIQRLIQCPPHFCNERIAGAAKDYKRLSTEWLDRLAGIGRLGDTALDDYGFVSAIQFYWEALFRLSSLECAAGTAPDRCRRLFRYMALLASYMPNGKIYPVHSDHASSFFALAQDYAKERYAAWPAESNYKNESSRVLYALMTGNPVEFNTALLHDDPYWVSLYHGIQQHNPDEVKAACMSLADYWYHDYAVNEVPSYDPERFPCFEPDCNAILAIALYREQIPIVFEEEKYRRFYLAALLE